MSDAFFRTLPDWDDDPAAAVIGEAYYQFRRVPLARALYDYGGMRVMGYEVEDCERFIKAKYNLTDTEVDSISSQKFSSKVRALKERIADSHDTHRKREIRRLRLEAEIEAMNLTDERRYC